MTGIIFKTLSPARVMGSPEKTIPLDYMTLFLTNVNHIKFQEVQLLIGYYIGPSHRQGMLQ